MLPPTARGCVSVVAAVGLWATTAHANAPHAAAKPTLAVFPLRAGQGVPQTSADLLSNAIVDELRQSGAFSRVVSQQEVETVLGLERQRQLMNCEATSCVAEIAGALGVDLVFAGTLGKLGTTALFSVSVLNSRDGTARGSITVQACAEQDEMMVRTLHPLIQGVLHNSQLLAAGTVVPSPPPQDCRRMAEWMNQPPPATTQAGRPASSMPRTLRISGGVLTGVAVLPLLLGGALVVGSSALLGVLYAVPAAREPVTSVGSNWFLLMHVPTLVGLGAAAVLVLLGVVGGAAGVGMLGAGLAL